MAFSRKQVLDPKELDLNKVIGGVRIELITRLDARLGRVKADAGQLEQVVMNLALNARDAMVGEGTLMIEAANVGPPDAPGTPTGPHDSLSWVELRVTDTGCGMDPRTPSADL